MSQFFRSNTNNNTPFSHKYLAKTPQLFKAKSCVLCYSDLILYSFLCVVEITCPKEADALVAGTESCDGSNDYQTLCEYECNRGYELIGASSRTSKDVDFASNDASTVTTPLVVHWRHLLRHHAADVVTLNR